MAISSEGITVDDAPTTINPYTVLSLPTAATADEVKTAYRKAALRHHPDKAPESEKTIAHSKFQDVALAYAVLSDPRRRARYDATGRTEESLDLDDDDDFDWASFFRTQFAEVVTEERIAAFAKEYKGSEEERGHLLASYTKREGNLRKVYQEVMLSDVLEDEERFRAVIDQAIKDGEVKDYKAYSQESEKSRKGRFAEARLIKERESKEAAEAKNESEEKKTLKDGTNDTKAKKGGKKDTGGGLGSLAAMIQKRQQSRAGAADSFFENLEEKYAPKGKKGTKRAADDEPSEEAFAKNRATKVDHFADLSAGSRKRTRSKM